MAEPLYEAISTYFRHRFNRPSLGRQAAGALIFDPAGRLLLVKDRIRHEWGYPGGYVDRNESPLEACMREVAEEVGLIATQQRFVELGQHQWRRPLGTLTFTTFGLAISRSEAVVKLQAWELIDYRWVTRSQALEQIAPRLRERLSEAFMAYDRRVALASVG